MCGDCYAGYGSPKVQNAKVSQAVSLIGKVYETNICGGGLHAVIDDWNLEAWHITSCSKWIDKSQAGRVDQQELAALLLSMTLDERASALAIYDRYLEVGL